MIIIGSRGLALRAPQLLTRPTEDFDFVCSKIEFDKWLQVNESKVKPKKIYEEGDKIIIEGSSNCEFEIIKPGHSSELLAELIKNDKDTIETLFGLVPTLDLLFTIKDSHKYKKFQNTSRGFYKTAIDWHVMKNAGACVRQEYEEFGKLRSRESYNYSHPKLNQSKKSFFADDNINYKYDHDTIHQSVALYDRPAYTYYLKDGQEINCDKAKFFACSRDIQLAGVLEEALTLALERSQIPYPSVMTAEQSFRFALAKVCSSITSGWFRQFAFENMFDVLKMYPKNYLKKFNDDVKSGLVRRI